MKKWLYLSLLALILLISSAIFLKKEKGATGMEIEQVMSSNQEGEKEMTEEVLKDLYRQVNQAMVDKDTSKLEELLKADTELVHMTGYKQPVSEWLNQIDSEEMKYYSWKEEVIKDIVIDGDKASLTGQSRVRARIWGGGPHTWPLQIEMHFEKVDGQWEIVKQIASTY